MKTQDPSWWWHCFRLVIYKVFFSLQCQTIVNEYANKIIKLILSGAGPKEICKLLTFCMSSSGMKKVQMAGGIGKSRWELFMSTPNFLFLHTLYQYDSRQVYIVC